MTILMSIRERCDAIMRYVFSVHVCREMLGICDMLLGEIPFGRAFYGQHKAPELHAAVITQAAVPVAVVSVHGMQP